MARKGGKRGGSSAARSAAAKKGWETRRRGGAKAKPTKPTARKATAPSKPKQAAGRRGMPKTTSARGRALTNQRRAADLVRASRGGKGPSAKAVRSVLTAQRARAFYAATGGGKKRSAVKAKSAVKIGKQIRAEGRAKATAARAKVAGRVRNRVVAKPAEKSNGNARQRALINYNKALRRSAGLDAGKRSDVALATARRALDVYAGRKPTVRPIGFTSSVRQPSTTAKPKPAQYGRIRSSIDPAMGRQLLQDRARTLRQAATATGAQRRALLGAAGRQAESLSIGGNAPNRTGRGNNQLSRAGRRAAANYVRVERALANSPAGASRKKLQKKLDLAFAALASLPKTRLPR